MTSFLKRLTATLSGWLGLTALVEPLTPAHGWLLPDPRRLPVLRQPVRVTADAMRVPRPRVG
jgi:hypothetical protein